MRKPITIREEYFAELKERESSTGIPLQAQLDEALENYIASVLMEELAGKERSSS